MDTLVGRFTGGNEDQQRPQIIAIPQVGKLPCLSAQAEAFKGTLHYIVFVFGAARRVSELFPCESDQAVIVTLPDSLRGLLIAGL
jgi:hypothetical protein